MEARSKKGLSCDLNANGEGHTNVLSRSCRMLASVLSVEEARACVSVGVDVVDCKDPNSGALGALDAQIVRDIVSVVGGKVLVSATVGDLPCRVGPVVDGVVRTAELGVDIVKVGLFSESAGEAGADGNDGGVVSVIEALGRLKLNGARLVAVLLADNNFDLSLVAPLSKAGFCGVMVDTADKSAGSLLDVLSEPELFQFIACARKHSVFSGLAGRLRYNHIDRVLSYGPDIVGFRGALCNDGIRGAGLDLEALAAVRRAIPQTRATANNLLKDLEVGENA